MQHLAQTQALGLSADVLGSFASRASSTASKYILHGFTTVSGIAAANANPAQNQLQIAPGTGLLAYRQGAGSPLYGVMAALDGTDQSAQGLDMTYQPTGPYQVFLRLNYADGAQTDRSFWSPAGSGYEFAQLTPSRKVATWEVQVLATGSNPGAEWLAIASLQWTAPATQGGVGTIASLQDLRPLYFEGNPAASVPYSASWGAGANDRNADRSTYGIGDLKTFVDAVKACLEDIKGPGLARWWAPGVAGINVGFTPNTPSPSRVALGDSSFYLQGRTAGSAGHAYLTTQTDGNGRRTGWDFATDRTRYLLFDNPVMTYSGFGTVGFGQLAEVDIMANPGRSLVEMVVTTTNQSALRLGARAINGATPVGLDVNLNIVAPDQTGNMARVLFSRGGVQGTEAQLYWLGKGADNGFVINDIAGNSNFFSFQPASKTIGFAGGPMVFNDIVNTVTAFSYSTATRVMTFSGGVSASTLNATGLISGNNVTAPNGNITTLGTANLTAQATVNSPQYNLSGTTFAVPGRFQIPTGASAPANPTAGAMFCRTGNANNLFNRVYVYIPDYPASPDDGLPQGWKALAV